MARLHAMLAYALRCSRVFTGFTGASAPRARLDRIICYRSPWPVSEVMEKLGNLPSEQAGEERPFGPFVVSLSKERANAGLHTATTPAVPGRDEARQLTSRSHAAQGSMSRVHGKAH